MTSHSRKGNGEMRRNRRLLLAGGIAAVVALAIPALALSTAKVWKDKGTSVTKFVEFAAIGGELFETTTGNGMSCEVRAVFTTEGGSTGKVTKFEIKKCPTGFGSFAGCELNTAEAKGLPWTTHITTTDLEITSLRTKRTFKAGCPTSELDKTIGTVTVTLETATEINEMDFEGSITGYKTNGTITVEGANNKTYGIG
jgi:hypothetical protein